MSLSPRILLRESMCREESRRPARSTVAQANVLCGVSNVSADPHRPAKSQIEFASPRLTLPLDQPGENDPPPTSSPQDSISLFLPHTRINRGSSAAIFKL